MTAGTFLQAPEAVGKVFTIDLKCEISEVERLGLEEPLGLLKTFTIQVAASGTGYAAALDLDETKKRCAELAVDIVSRRG
jgi:hypothetical protein